MRAELEKILDWANAKIACGQEPPWAWYQYMKLRETLEAILAGMSSVTTESSPRSAAHPETHLRLVATTDRQDDAPRPAAPRPTRLPM